MPLTSLAHCDNTSNRILFCIPTEERNLPPVRIVLMRSEAFLTTASASSSSCLVCWLLMTASSCCRTAGAHSCSFTASVGSYHSNESYFHDTHRHAGFFALYSYAFVRIQKLTVFCQVAEHVKNDVIQLSSGRCAQQLHDPLRQGACTCASFTCV